MAKVIEGAEYEQRGASLKPQDDAEGSMASLSRRYSKEELASRGDAAFASAVRPRLQPDDEGRFVAIDIDTNAFEIDDDELRACDRLRARFPEAQIWLVRVGSRYVHRFGGRDRRDTP